MKQNNNSFTSSLLYHASTKSPNQVLNNGRLNAAAQMNLMWYGYEQTVLHVQIIKYYFVVCRGVRPIREFYFTYTHFFPSNQKLVKRTYHAKKQFIGYIKKTMVSAKFGDHTCQSCTDFLIFCLLFKRVYFILIDISNVPQELIRSTENGRINRTLKEIP